MTLSEFDKNNIGSILDGSGDWFSAHVIRFLDSVLFKADANNLRELWRMYPEHCAAIYRHYGWTDAQINTRLESAGIYANY